MYSVNVKCSNTLCKYNARQDGCYYSDCTRGTKQNVDSSTVDTAYLSMCKFQEKDEKILGFSVI